MSLRIGVDIGPTTVKMVLLDEQNKPLLRSYERHYSETRERAAETPCSLADRLAGRQVRTVITGSAGLSVAKAVEIDLMQEAYATAVVANQYISDADAATELGGEDAKVVSFGGALEERMNDSCAGGTDAFIDQMATLMNVTVNELDELSLRHEKIYPIASRCGVSAKSDIQLILSQGGRKEDVTASILRVVVDQMVTGLIQGRELKGKIVSLGGPLHFLVGLRQRLVETLKLDADHTAFSEDGDCFTAMGAALCSSGYGECSFDEVLDRLEKSVDSVGLADIMPLLFDSQEGYDVFLARHNAMHPSEVDIHTYTGAARLGTDTGSTTTKIVLITADGGLPYTYHYSDLGNPIAIVLEQLREIYKPCGSHITIKGAAVIGYGEDLIKNAFSCDAGLVEMAAHYSAACHSNPDADFIIGIGGQDMKRFKIRNGAVDSIMLNEACSSSCGPFIETFVKALGYTTTDFAKLGLLARHLVNLGSRCTALMNSSVKQAQRDGTSVEDISAGLSISIVKNAVYKVIRAANADDLGQHIVVWGGIFHNDAVLRIFEQELGRNVTQPTISGTMGVFGVAPYAKDLHLEKSALLSEEALQSFPHTVKSITCNLCTNHCSLTVNTLDDGRRFISGNRCSRPSGKVKVGNLDLMTYKYKKLRALQGKGSGNGIRGHMGISFGPNMYENLPFRFELFARLNFEVVSSPESSRKFYLKGQHTISSDAMCYPARLFHGHMEALVEEDVDVIWYPRMSYNNDEGIGDNHYNCPVVAYYSELLVASVPLLKQTRFLNPYVGLRRCKGSEKRITQLMEEHFSIPRRETAATAKAAYVAYDIHVHDVRETGMKYIRHTQDHHMPVLVVCGRPYHIDPEINHDISDLITSFGFVLVTRDALNYLEGCAPRKALNQWAFQSRMYNAARHICIQPGTQMVQLISFGCGTDAITIDELRDILEKDGKLYIQLRVDDISNPGVVKTRTRSLMAVMEARQAQDARD